MVGAASFLVESQRNFPFQDNQLNSVGIFVAALAEQIDRPNSEMFHKNVLHIISERSMK